jgi:hypothetical protein
MSQSDEEKLENLWPSIADEALGQIDPRELSPHVPLLWRDFCLAERPYASPDEEYIRSPYPVPVRVLRERWYGLIRDTDLRMLRETAALKRARFAYQEEVAREAFKQSIAGDIEFQRRRIDQEIVDLCNLIEKVQRNLDEDTEYAPSRGAGALGYVKRPQSIDSLKKLVDARIALSESLAKRMGLATEVWKVTVEQEETLEQRMARVLAERDPQFAKLKHLAQGGVLNEGVLTAFEGASRESELRVEREHSRIIDVQPRQPYRQQEHFREEKE